MAKQSLVRDFFAFVKHEKKWWMIPLISVLLVVATLFIVVGATPASLAPFIYSMF